MTLISRISPSLTRRLVVLAAGLLLCTTVSHATGSRVTDGLLVYYPFTQDSGTSVLDRSGTGAPMDLQISGEVSWLAGQNGVVLSDGQIGTVGPATKLIDGLQASDRGTFEVWAIPANLTQDGPARMISVEDNGGQPTYLMGQLDGDLHAWLLHTGKDELAQPWLVTSDGFLTTSLLHLVHTYDGTTERLYVNGVEHPTTVTETGDFSNWNPADLFTIGNESISGQPWAGTLRMVAVYDRDLTPAEVLQNFSASPDVASAPRVDAGSDRATPVAPLAPPHGVVLDGSVLDDGLPDPPGSVTTTWSMLSGPGTVVFGDPAALQTTADFSADGVYVLQLSADDGQWVGSDTVTIGVNMLSTQLTTVNLLPADLAINVSTNPTLELVCPVDSALGAHYVVGESADFSSIVYDSGVGPNYVCSHVAFAGLSGATEYHWSARVQDDTGAWTDWSVPTSFTTIDSGVLSTHAFRQGVDGYTGASDADVRGSAVDPSVAIREWNQGAYTEMRTGRRPAGFSTDEIFRALLRFDVSNLTDPDAVVNAHLELTGWSEGESFLFHPSNRFYEVLRPWGEGNGVSGAAPDVGEVSWTYSEFPAAWSIAGVGDAGIDRGASPVMRGRLTNQTGHKTFWSSQALVDLVKSWIDQPLSNFGFMIQADDEAFQERMNLATKEHSDPSFRPRLVIETSDQPDCLSAPNADPCDDGNTCTLDGSCDAGMCVDGPVAPDGHETSCGIGACAAMGSCSGGVDSCVPGTPAADDATCDAVDDDCDTLVDEDYTPAATSCGVGACSATGALVCTAGTTEDSCIPGAPADDDATCDGIDDDCDDLHDEDFLPVPSSCGIGACTAIGTTACVAGLVEDVCTPGAPAADDATCDGIDDDCDDLFDEDYLAQPTSCGVGACVAAGTSTCVAGLVENDCTPGDPALDDATCDGIDDDCDGLIDEDYSPQATSCGVGACSAAGTTSCVDGQVENVCTPGDPALDDSGCDGIDDDCDGLFDEDYLPQPSSCGTGACAATGTTECVAGQVGDVCSPGDPALDDAGCDGIDDDCDGLFDEDYVSEPAGCGIGACAETGTTVCVAGLIENDCTPGAPAPTDTTCDGIDDDCDGSSDEDYWSMSTNCGVGACSATGVLSCVAGAVEDSCTPGTPAIGDATCDGIDDDCDSLFDEDYSSEPTGCGVGACSSSGATYCAAGVVEDDCAPGQPAADDATCDGIDDDCDSLFDEDYLPEPTSCGVGACSSAGATYCAAGVVEDDCTPGQPAIDDATCDGIDDDCDTLLDEDYLSVPTSCGLGACSATGASACSAGIVEDDCSPGAPGTEYCDGLDNDCDGVIDEGDSADALVWYRDADGDTHGDPDSPMTACVKPTGFVFDSTDCDDSNVNTHPGALEFNDGMDNQCFGDAGHGFIDEIMDGFCFEDPTNDAKLSWPAQPGVTLYEIKRSSMRTFSAGCISFTAGNSIVFDPEEPAAGGTFYYLVRPYLPYAGSWGAGTAGERMEVCP